MLKKRRSPPATKDDLKRFATKNDLKRFATKEDLKRFATKDDLHTFGDALKSQIRAEVVPEVRRLLVADLEEMNERLLRTYGERWKREIQEGVVSSMQVINENLVHDFRGAFSDRTQLLHDKVYNHEGRLKRVEGHLRLVY